MDYVKQYIDNILDQKIEIFDKWISAIEEIDDNDTVAVWGTTEQTEYLLKCTSLGKKNVTWIDRSKTSFQGHKVFKPSDVDFSQFDHVVISSFNYRKEIQEELFTKYHYDGNIVDVHSPEDKVRFYNYYKAWDMEKNSAKFKRSLAGAIIPNEVITVLRNLVAIRKRIREIDNSAKIAVYGGKEHIEYLLRYTDLAKKNVVCYVDNEKSTSQKQTDFTGIDAVILSMQDGKEQFAIELRTEYSFPGQIIDLYSSEEATEFYQCVFATAEDEKAFESKVLFEVVNDFCHDISSQGNVIINFKIYNRFSDNGPKNFYRTNWHYEDTVIVIQGPIKYDDDFTYHTVLQYFKMFPDVNIVLSAWKDELKEERFKLFQTIPNLHIVLCNDPEEPGLMNVNRQMCSAYAGLKYAYQNLGVKYALKIRSDARLYSPESLELMKTGADYKYTNPNGTKLKARIVCSPLQGAGNIFSYYFADYYNFGYLEDMLKFWNPELVSHNEAYRYILPGYRLKNPEQFLYSRYAYQYISPNAEDESQYGYILKDFFYFLSLDSIDFLWNEYWYHSEEARCCSIGSPWKNDLEKYGAFSYAEWLKLIAEIDG